MKASENRQRHFDSFAWLNHTDVLVPIFYALQNTTGTRPYTGKVGDEDQTKVNMAYEVVAHHIITLVISISDGGRPDNIGRGYLEIFY